MSKQKLNWHFIPELPKNDKEVLIAIQFDEFPIQGYYKYGKWKGSFLLLNQ